MTLCNNNGQTWFSDTLTSAGPLIFFKTLTFRLGFQHHTQGRADVNAYQNKIDPYNCINKKSFVEVNHQIYGHKFSFTVFH